MSTPTELTFLLDYDDGTTAVETVPLDFTDIPPGVMADIIRQADTDDLYDVTARVLAYRLTVPLDVARGLLDELQRGEGVVSG